MGCVAACAYQLGRSSRKLALLFCRKVHDCNACLGLDGPPYFVSQHSLSSRGIRKKTTRDLDTAAVRLAGKGKAPLIRNPKRTIPFATTRSEVTQHHARPTWAGNKVRPIEKKRHRTLNDHKGPGVPPSGERGSSFAGKARAGLGATIYLLRLPWGMCRSSRRPEQISCEIVGR